MNYTISNEKLTIKIASYGAELQSIQTKDGTEYLWQGDSRWWEDKAPNLFPYIGRLTNQSYTLEGKKYHMLIHGFAKLMEYTAENAKTDSLVLSLKENETTLEQYPYKFDFKIIYKLEGNKLHVTYYVKNNDEKIMYFAVGGHPGFNVPLEKGLSFDDYYVEFEGSGPVEQVEFTEACFLTGRNVPFELSEGNRFCLSYPKFDDDAIVLADTAHVAELKSDKGTRAVRVTYPQMDYLGMWTWPKATAPYLCIEPWSTLPSRQDIVEDFAEQPGMLSLDPGAVYENTYSIEIIE